MASSDWYVSKDGFDGPRAKCRKWKIYVKDGTRMASSGRERYATRRVSGMSYTEACEIARSWRREIEEGLDRPIRKGAKFDAIWRAWMRKREQTGELSEKTLNKDAYALSVLSPFFSSLNVSHITPELIEDAYSDILEGKTASGKPLSKTSLLTVHNTTRRFFSWCVETGLIATNPLSKVKPPKADTGERKALRISQTKSLLERLDASDVRQLAISLMLRTGMRSEEVLGIERRDLVGGTLSIRREITKTDSGARLLPLSDQCVDDLRAYGKMVERRLRQLGMLGPGESLPETTKLLCNEVGQPIKYDSLRRWWARNRASFGLEGWTLHEFRHTHLSNLAEAGVQPRVMQSIAGHSDIRTTMQIYTHVNDIDKLKAIDRLQEAMDERY